MHCKKPAKMFFSLRHLATFAILTHHASSQVVPDVDATLVVNGDASDAFSLQALDDNDQDTFQVFQLSPDPLPLGSAITCTVTCTSSGGTLDLYMKFGSPFADATDGTLAIDGGDCGDSGMVTSGSAGTGYVMLNDPVEPFTDAVVECTGVIPPTPSPTPSPVSPVSSPTSCFTGAVSIWKRLFGWGPF